jgi:L,D-peptidoglycan transpeptidase YkuD (ErfK/YbiS/YcfS/YnhG family)
MPAGYRMRGDWTAGCIALTDAQIEELWAHATIGTVVDIRP